MDRLTVLVFERAFERPPVGAGGRSSFVLNPLQHMLRALSGIVHLRRGIQGWRVPLARRIGAISAAQRPFVD